MTGELHGRSWAAALYRAATAAALLLAGAMIAAPAFAADSSASAMSDDAFRRLSRLGAERPEAAVPAPPVNVTLTLANGAITPSSATMLPGDKLVVVNDTKTRQFVWGQRVNYAFDYRATPDDTFTHEPGQSLAIALTLPGIYQIGVVADPHMRATVTVESPR